MTEPDWWEPDGDLEERLLFARAKADDERFLRRLALADLYLPLLPEEVAAGQGLNWVTSVISGQQCVVAFTSEKAMYGLMHAEPPYRLARFFDLGRTWPDPKVWLAVDPGLPIEAYLTPKLILNLGSLASEPSNPFEEALAEAAVAEDIEAYARALLGADLVLPIDPNGSATRELTDPDFPWTRMTDEGNSIVAFTSDERFREILGGGQESVTMRFADIAAGWPDPEIGLAVNPGHAFGAVLNGSAVFIVGQRAHHFEEIAVKAINEARARNDLTEGQQFQLAQQRVAEEMAKLGVEFDAAPAAPPAAGPPAEPAGGVAGLEGEIRELMAAVEDGRPGQWVQVVVLAAQRDRYLRQGHDRVAGLVHRRPSGAVPLHDLYQRLGLLGDGSPFGADDDRGFLLRWWEDDGTAFQAPEMTGLAVPDGASFWQVDRAGHERLLARYGAGSGWTIVPNAPV
jgi:type III secretion system (T3SS) SseB-like protein